jgi:pimeloyl-ACP methyl ester carboxylesterase
MPTLVVWGARDRVFPKSQGEEAAARLQRGSLELIPDCAHLPHVERPELFVAALEGFLG